MKNEMIICVPVYEVVKHTPASVAIAVSIAPAPIKPFIEALESKRIKDCSPIEIKAALSEALTIANFALGRKTPDSKADPEGYAAHCKDYNLTIEQLYPDVVSNFSLLHVKEIKLAFKNGALGLHGENYGLNIATCFRWLTGHSENARRLEAKQTLLNANKEEEAKSERVVTREERIVFVETAFETFKKTGMYIDWGNVVYNFLDAEGLIPFTIAEKNHMMNQVRHTEFERLGNPINGEERRKFMKEIEQMMESDAAIIPKVKRFALQEYFKRLIAAGNKLEFKHQLGLSA